MSSYNPGYYPVKRYTHTLPEVAQALGVSRGVVRRIIALTPNKDFYYHEKIDGSWKYNFKEILKAIQESQNGINTPVTANGVTVTAEAHTKGINGRDGRPNNLSTPTSKIRLRSERRKSV